MTCAATWNNKYVPLLKKTLLYKTKTLFYSHNIKKLSLATIKCKIWTGSDKSS